MMFCGTKRGEGVVVVVGFDYFSFFWRVIIFEVVSPFFIILESDYF